MEFLHLSPFLRVFYAVLSTGPVQNSPTRFLRVFQYQEHPKISYAISTHFKYQDGPTRFLRVFQYQKHPKISYAIPTCFSVPERYKTADRRHRRSLSEETHCSEESTNLSFIFFVQLSENQSNYPWEVKQLLNCRVAVFWGGHIVLFCLVNWHFKIF